MLKKVTIALALLAMASLAYANSYNAEGTVLDSSFGYDWQADRLGLVTDGSFENGCDVDWACLTDNGCAWITDLVPLGLWNYDGNMVAWLGGFCGGAATCYTTICQDILIDGGCLTHYWMGYVNYGETAQFPAHYQVTVDGNVVSDVTLLLSDHLLDYQQTSADVAPYMGGTHTVCFELHNEDGCIVNEGDNYFMDYVELEDCGTATEDANFSTVKALY